MDLSSCPGYVGPQHELSVWFSLPSACHWWAAFTLMASNASLLSQPTAWGLTLASPPALPGAGQVLLTLLFSLPSCILVSSAWNCIFPSGGQGLLLVLSWSSVRASEPADTFLMPLWRQMYYTLTYSSAILSVFYLKKTCKWTTGTSKDAQHWWSLGKCQLKVQWGITSTVIWMAIIKKSTNNKCWRVCGGKGTVLHCW